MHRYVTITKHLRFCHVFSQPSNADCDSMVRKPIFKIKLLCRVKSGGVDTKLKIKIKSFYQYRNSVRKWGSCLLDFVDNPVFWNYVRLSKNKKSPQRPIYL